MDVMKFFSFFAFGKRSGSGHPSRKRLLVFALGILSVTLASLVPLFAELISQAGSPEHEKGKASMTIHTLNASHPAIVPPLDVAVPGTFETATFALG
jgi:hypothetical protein